MQHLGQLVAASGSQVLSVIQLCHRAGVVCQKQYTLATVGFFAALQQRTL